VLRRQPHGLWRPDRRGRLERESRPARHRRERTSPRRDGRPKPQRRGAVHHILPLRDAVTLSATPLPQGQHHDPFPSSCRPRPVHGRRRCRCRPGRHQPRPADAAPRRQVRFAGVPPGLRPSRGSEVRLRLARFDARRDTQRRSSSLRTLEERAKANLRFETNRLTLSHDGSPRSFRGPVAPDARAAGA
jgi:hypothetical protein